MFRTVCGLVVLSLILLVVTGCGGGGGGAVSSLVGASRTLPSSLVATWTVTSLGLPNDELTVQSSGQVTVAAAEVRSTTSSVVIGTCSEDGVLSLDGSWSISGETYSINGSGAINPSSNSLIAQATVQCGEAIVCSNAQVTGTKAQAEDIDTPPPPPEDDGSGDEELDTPPPAPY